MGGHRGRVAGLTKQDEMQALGCKTGIIRKSSLIPESTVKHKTGHSGAELHQAVFAGYHKKRTTNKSKRVWFQNQIKTLSSLRTFKLNHNVHSFAFRFHVQGVMFYLDGLFVSQSNAVPPDPLLCFAIEAGVLQGHR